MNHLVLLFKKFSFALLATLKPLGFWGAGVIAMLDSSTIPVPMDVLIATWAWDDRRHWILYVVLAAAGSAVGGLLPFLLGRAGGELFLLKRIDRRRFEQLRDRFARQEFVALLVPSCLPPPTPWKLFVFASGVFEMKVVTYLLAVFCGRMVRFGLEAFLTMRYGLKVIDEVGRLMHEHAHLILTLLGLVLLAVLVQSLRQNARRKTNKIAPEAQ